MKSHRLGLTDTNSATRYPDLSRPLRAKLAPVLGTAVSVTTAMFTFAYLPQAAFLALFSGPLAVFSAIFLTLSESATITHILSRGLFIDDAMVDTFDGTLLHRNQSELVAQGRQLHPSSTAGDAMSRMGKVLKVPFAKFNITAMLRYFLYLPLNFIPIVGPVIYLFIQARKYGPNAHARYFQLKNMNKRQREEFAEQHAPAYTGFGIPAQLLEMIPFLGIFFSFTNTVGAALFAADLEKSTSRPSVPEPPPATTGQTQGVIRNDDPPAYEDHEF